MEMNFLMEGIIINLEDISKTAVNSLRKRAICLTKQRASKPLTFRIEIPKETFDYSFRILDTAVSQNPSIRRYFLPIQLYVVSHKAQLCQSGIEPCL